MQLADHHQNLEQYMDNKIKNSKGFTLIELIMYIALFSIITTGAFITVYQLLESSDRLSKQSMVQSEANFVLRKIDWALEGLSTTTSDVLSPATFYPYQKSSTLSIKKYYMGEKMDVLIQYNGTTQKIMFKEKTNTSAPITSDNIHVSKLEFQYIPGIGSSPPGIAATFIINEKTFMLTKYIKK